MKKLACLILLGLVGCGTPIGETYQDVDAIAISRDWSDWVIVGAFGPKGPFELVDIKYCEVSQPCQFSHNGQSHTYQKFTGFKLVVLRLEGADGNVSHVVLRSMEKFT